MSDQWRMAFMFDALNGDLATLEQALKNAAGDIRKAAEDAPVRIGVADRHPDLETSHSDYETGDWRKVDGAIEITLRSDAVNKSSEISAALTPILQTLCIPATIEVMAGPVFSIVPVREGGAFLSLAFKRYPGTTSTEFRNWWLRQHSGLAVDVLGPGLLAYDQVHVDQDVSAGIAAALGVAPCAYDAYDNLTWTDRKAFLHSCSDADAMARVYEDEIGRIDNGTRRSSLMRDIERGVYA